MVDASYFAYMSSITVKMSKKTENIISYGLVVFGSLIYISLCFNYNVWLDEAFTASLVRTDMAGVLERSMADTLPPLYNILLKLSTDIFGYNVPVMKLTSVMPMIATMLISATVVRKRHGFWTSSLFTVLLFSMPNLLFFGVEIRMYSLGFMFATASGIFAYELIQDYSKKNLIVFTLVSVLAGYSHHFAFVSVGFVYLFLLVYYFVLDRKNIKRWFICLLLTFILYFPCLIVTLKQFKSVSGYFSMPDVTFPVFIKYCRYPFTSGNTVGSIVLLISVGMMLLYTVVRLIGHYKSTRGVCTSANKDSGEPNKNSVSIINSSWNEVDILSDLYAVSMFLVYYGVLVFGTIVSKIMTANIFVDRYLFFAHGMLWLFFAIEVGKLRKYYYIFAAIAVYVSIMGYVQEYGIEYSTNPNEVVSYLESNVSAGDVLYTIEDAEEMAFCLPFYDELLTNYEDLSEAVDVAEKNNSDIWLTVMDYSDYDFSELNEYGLKAEDRHRFTFDRYTFDMYKLSVDR